jgi:hypothetical protein
MTAGELTAGFRATRDITVKASYYARQPYGRQDWDQQGGHVDRLATPVVVMRIAGLQNGRLAEFQD